MAMDTTSNYGLPAPAAGTPAEDYDDEFAAAMTSADTALKNALDGKAADDHDHDADYEATGAYRPGGTDVAVADGGTGASDAAGARSNLGAAAIGHNHDADYGTPRQIFETAQGTWTADAPAGRTPLDPRTCIEFVGVTDPTDDTNGIDTPANIVAGDTWTQVADYLDDGDGSGEGE